MVNMTVSSLEPSDAALDREIEKLIGDQVRGELTSEGEMTLRRLLARRGRQMRPSLARGVPAPPPHSRFYR
jgi:hypothetical protein